MPATIGLFIVCLAVSCGRGSHSTTFSKKLLSATAAGRLDYNRSGLRQSQLMLLRWGRHQSGSYPKCLIDIITIDI